MCCNNSSKPQIFINYKLQICIHIISVAFRSVFIYLFFLDRNIDDGIKMYLHMDKYIIYIEIDVGK